MLLMQFAARELGGRQTVLSESISTLLAVI